MMREFPPHVITDVRDQSKNNGNPAFAHPNMCPECSPVSATVIAMLSLFTGLADCFWLTLNYLFTYM